MVCVVSDSDVIRACNVTPVIYLLKQMYFTINVLQQTRTVVSCLGSNVSKYKDNIYINIYICFYNKH